MLIVLRCCVMLLILVHQAKDRLELVLDYLRRRYAYCFWCGTQYNDEDDMATNCPGPDEESHD